MSHTHRRCSLCRWCAAGCSPCPRGSAPVRAGTAPASSARSAGASGSTTRSTTCCSPWVPRCADKQTATVRRSPAADDGRNSRGRRDETREDHSRAQHSRGDISVLRSRASSSNQHIIHADCSRGAHCYIVSLSCQCITELTITNTDREDGTASGSGHDVTQNATFCICL